MPTPPQNLRQLSALVEIVSHLRGPDGCPWDKKQTHESLTQYAIEETYEFVEAVSLKNDQEIKAELGDVLFQVILHAQLASERRAFDLEDVIENINKKLLHRHPHVFEKHEKLSPEEVEKQWAERKALEKKAALKDASVNDHLRMNFPSHLPALQKAAKIGHASRKFGFDWPDVTGVIAKIDEEIQELKEALTENNQKEIIHEMGDVLFSVAQLSRHLNLDPEQALRECNVRFMNRYHTMLELCDQRGLLFSEQSDDQKESLWSEAKKIVKSKNV